MEQRRTPLWRRLVGSEEVTEPIPLVERLRGTPYHDPRRMDVPEDDEVRGALDVLLHIAELGLRSGSGTAEVEASVVATAAALGLRDEALELDITFSSVVLGYAPEGEPSFARVKVVRGVGRDYARMSAVHAFVSDLAGGRVTREEVAARLAEIDAAPRPYGRWWVSLAWGGLASAVTVRLGGGLLAALSSFVVTVVVDRCGRYLSRRGMPPFFLTLVGAALATACAVVLFALGPVLPGVGPDDVPPAALVVAGGIVVLLPGIGFVAAVQDGIRGFPVTAVGRLFQVLLLTGAIIAGVVLVLDLARRLGVSVVIGDPRDTSAFVDAAVRVAAASVGSACAALAMRTPPRLLVPAAVVGASGFTLFTVSEGLGSPAAVSTAAAAVLIGAAGRVWALRRRAAPLAVVVPALTMLLPGLVIFEALRELTFGESAQGLLTLLEAATIAVSLGAGAVLGDQIAKPLQQGLDTVGDRRRRPR